jgi:hypothetical protein
MSSPSFEIPFQEVGLLLSGLIFVGVSIGGIIARRMNGQATPALKYGITALWLAAVLRLYSASAFLWAKAANEAGLIPLTRSFVLVVLTLELIFVMALVTYYYRRIRR